MATVILCNPMGADVTPFVNNTPFIPQLLKGTVLQPGDTLYTLPYTNQPGIANIAHGVALLDAKIRSTSGVIRVFSYSEGCQIADMWISQNYSNPPVSGSNLSFVSIGNADRKYGGFVYGRSVFSTVGYTGGLPNHSLPWAYTDFARQYDAVADFPTDPVIEGVLNSIGSVTNDITVFPSTLQAVWNLVTNPAKAPAAENALYGLALIHNFYLNVTLNDVSNAWYTDPTTGVRYGLALTYPVPLLGVGNFAAADQSLRPEIEACYSRPMTALSPNYGLATGGAATQSSFGEPLGNVRWALSNPSSTTPWVASVS